ncbi:YceI family protein [Brumimicrobium mesophilum]|uniref:YceI family protein n=1 Tax=Brumimicrobium mesophilum TaxID=392717 RepID=UPI000D1433BB|nr:YceI family protein [Brumimicrobium mesophilum]
MTKKFNLFFFFIFFSSLVFSQEIDKRNSSISFEISNMLVNTVEGSFSGFTGEINFNENNLSQSQINVCIDASTVNTGIEKRDDHLRTKDFFHVEKYPKICFTSTNIIRNNTGYFAEGQLEMHGVKKNVKIPLNYSNNTLLGSLVINRFDYEIGVDSGSFNIGKKVYISIKCVLM